MFTSLRRVARFHRQGRSVIPACVTGIVTSCPPEYHLFRQCESHERVSVRSSEHSWQESFDPAAPSGGNDDILAPVDAIGRRAAVMPTTHLELPQHLSGPGVVGIVFAGRLTREHQVTASRQYRSTHGPFGARTPDNLAAGIDGTDRTLHVLCVYLHRRTPIRNTFFEFTPPSRYVSANILDRNIEQFGVRVVRGVRPLFCASRTRPERYRLPFLLGIYFLSYLTGGGRYYPRLSGPRTV